MTSGSTPSSAGRSLWSGWPVSSTPIAPATSRSPTLWATASRTTRRSTRWCPRSSATTSTRTLSCRTSRPTFARTNPTAGTCSSTSTAWSSRQWTPPVVTACSSARPTPATSLALLGRHLERADHLARILGVHVSLSLDRADEPGPDFWVRFMELAGWRGSDTGRRAQAIEMVVAGTLGPSVRASIASARLAAQAVRPSLPTELYEQVNALHWRVQEAVGQPDLYPFPMYVQLS